MAEYPQIVYDDKDLFPVIERAHPDLREMLAALLATKVSCSIDARETGVAALTNELQRMGGHTLVNLSRGSGVPYREIVKDAFGVTCKVYPKDRSILSYEHEVVQKVVNAAVDHLTAEQAATLDAKLAKATESSITVGSLRCLHKLPHGVKVLVLRSLAVQVLEKAGADLKPKFSVNEHFEDFLVGIDLESFLVELAVVAVTGAVSTAVEAMGGALDVFGTAYTVTIPSILLVHLMRLEQENRDKSGPEDSLFVNPPGL
ncbi:MAG: hypothetical protein P1V35_06560 [Planctomycetota bacterium]|nr:hypothetical protein [Planctomycetota bacterium]